MGSPEGTPLEEPHWLPQKQKPSVYRRFFIFILLTIHQKALLKGFRRKKTRVFALFLRRL